MKQKQYFIRLDERNRIRVDLVILKNKISNFVVQLETFTEKWHPVIRYNYSHRFSHKDIIFANGRKIKERIDETNLSRVVNLAISDLKRNWINYLRRCGYEEE